ncbi:MAG: UDP-N-acetylmuramoyl-L-alanine--D-glutamate ligase [Lachnospiraceae bacterium]|nr:UDP-N-acetylmuramoyl-L-alanine--D-glutamate ligase [Lachnospiraceae bacterium]
MKEWSKERPILVAGAGISGTNAVRLIFETGYTPILYDGNVKLDQEKVFSKVGRRDFELVLGELTEDVIRRVQFCVMSPGIPLTRPFVLQLQEAGVLLMSEIALAYHFSKGRVGVVTGTNGKTTTTTLIGHIMKAVVPETYTVGNIGTPYSDTVLQTTDNSLTVIEASSFQLETIDEKELVPDLLVLTNIREDHLDRHGSLKNYSDIKKKLCTYMRPDQTVVINGEDEWLADLPDRTRARVLRFSSKNELEEGCFLREGEIILRMDKEEWDLCPTSKIQLLGMHNYENIMTGVLAAYALGAPVDVIREQILSFTAVAHRMEYVCTKNGVLFYNDSKATNPDSVVKAMEVVTPPVVLIAGGFDRHADYREMVESFRGKVRYIILLGTTARDIADAVAKYYPLPTALVSTMAEAVKEAKKAAVPGDTVLLSPACASWDMYPNFEIRGEEFKKLARED